MTAVARLTPCDERARDGRSDDSEGAGDRRVGDDRLTPIDLMNFQALMGMGVATVAKLPDGEYRGMAVFGLAVLSVVDGEKGCRQ